MLLEIFEQIEKELDYAEYKHPGQQVTKIDSLQFAIAKLREPIDNTKWCEYGCSDCTDTDKYICNSFAAIALLIRGIEQEIKVTNVVDKTFNRRNKLFDKLFKPRPQIKLSAN